MSIDAHHRRSHPYSCSRDVDSSAAGRRCRCRAQYSPDACLPPVGSRGCRHSSTLSLFSVQEGFLDGARERLIVADMQRRVRVFVLLQEELFRSHADLGFRDFVTRLVDSIAASFQQPGQQVEVATDLEDLEVSDRELLYCGLVVNEALTNAFKHAVPMVSEPRVEVQSGTDDRGRYLTVRDNGPGVPARSAPERHRSFGMTFLESLSGHSGWDLTIDGGSGTEVVFRF